MFEEYEKKFIQFFPKNCSLKQLNGIRDFRWACSWNEILPMEY